MIVKVFNNGWGDDVPIKQLEKLLIDQRLANDQRQTIIINSTWYTQDYHAQVLNELRQLEFDQIVLVSMLDAAIPQPDWYQEFNCDVRGLGYYPGSDFVDFWAMAVDRYFQRPSYEISASQIDTAYMCLNRKPHWHRKRLYNQLVSYNLVKHGIVSMGGDNSPALKTLELDQGECDLAPNACREQNGIAKDIMSLGHPSNWCRHFINIVTETQYDINKTYFVSEKIYKPILGSKPFLVYASDGGVEWLTTRGFETYTKDFTDITDLDLANPAHMPDFLAILCQQSQQYWQSKYVALQDKIKYNNNNFYTYIDKIKKGLQCQI